MFSTATTLQHALPCLSMQVAHALAARAKDYNGQSCTVCAQNCHAMHVAAEAVCAVFTWVCIIASTA